ncbi:RNA polymerase sigma factor [Arenibacter sp. ARW7G5Y1]|uniref:RNA polymerase sigma factor n=1 Tax=Arenibacter sp. ARW7G5Y1 TaxID=2135619 RepID=UPI000D83C9FA|nr:RNA polymerase sigma-70 factor [Arenibacter sp. ARW7G5Y1]PXX30602.1 RNA polymerase sigma-70 factor (ECF subfamily) [Arenibacter sp. ARW7G5Y1]
MIEDYSINKILAESLKDRKVAAYEYLMETYHHKLCIYAEGLCRDTYLAQDIVQNVFLRVWERHRNLNENLSIKNYLYQSVYNEFINQYRKKDNMIPLETEYIKTFKEIFDDDDDKDLTRLIILVQAEIQRLPPKCKEIFILGKQEGLTYTEIAEYLNVSFRTVENQMSKAFSIIRTKVSYKINTLLFLLFRIRKEVV